MKDTKSIAFHLYYF